MFKKSDKKGAILGIALIHMLICTLLGYGMLNLSAQDGVEVVKTVGSSQAFWLAEAGIEKATMHLPNTNIPAELINQPLGTGQYNITDITQVGTTPDLYRIISDGTVNTKTRTIQVRIEHKILTFPDDVLTARGPLGTLEIDEDGNVTGGQGSSNFDEDFGRDGLPNTVDPDNTEFTFEDIFGLSMEEVRDMATNYYLDPPNNVTPVDGITWVDVSPGDKFKVSSSADPPQGWYGEGILIVNGDAEMTGGEFYGILWVTGTFTAGNTIIQGTAFVDCDEGTTTNILGNPTFDYDPDAIEKALGGVPGGGSRNQYKPISWKEIPN